MQYADYKHLRHRAYVSAQVRRLAALLDQWDDWEIDQLLPPAERRLTRPPSAGKEAVSVLHRALMAELHDLSGFADR